MTEINWQKLIDSLDNEPEKWERDKYKIWHKDNERICCWIASGRKEFELAKLIEEL